MISSISSSSPSSMAAMAQMRSQKFSKADGDASGGLDVTEFQNLVAQGAGRAASDTSSVEEDFKAFDVDADGSLTQAELDAGFEQKMQAFRSTLATYGSDSAQSTQAAEGPSGPHGRPPGPPPAASGEGTSSTETEEYPLQALLAALQDTLDAKSAATSGSNTRLANELRELLRGLVVGAEGGAGQAITGVGLSVTA